MSRSQRPTTAKSPSSPPPDRRERRSAEIRERLFRAAFNLFAQKGFAETTVEDITNAADVGKGTFFNYFPSKEHILVAFSDMQIAKVQVAIDNVRQGHEPIREFLRNLSVRMTEEPAKSPDVIRAILQAYLSSSSVRSLMKEKNQRAEGLLTELVHIAQERGEFRCDYPPLQLAQVVRQTILGTWLMWSVWGDASLPDRINTALDVLWTGVARREPATAASQPT
jgi:AcrR family transcriptional regulator